MLAHRCPSEMSTTKNSNPSIQNDESTDEDSGPIQRHKKNVHRFSDSETEEDNLESRRSAIASDYSNQSDGELESNIPSKSGASKSRIQMASSDSESNDAVKNMEQQLRMKNKRNKLKNKFKNLLSSREKQASQDNSDKKSSSGSPNEASDPSDSEMSSIAKIKQKIKKSMASMSSVCDPDTSDEESHSANTQPPKQRQKKASKSIKMTEPKPIRMSAKQAMANMQLIKSESNRMLREKAVSLPYHRPKVLSLKDIMSRRRPAVSSDGKALPIKMNEDQLKQYAELLEQRQKEMMELCKSESEEECNEEEEKLQNNTESKEDDQEINKKNNEEIDQVTCIMTDSENFASEIVDKPNSSNEIIESVATETVTKDVEVNNKDIEEESLKNASSSLENLNSKNECEAHDNDLNNQSEDSVKNDSDLNLVYNESAEEENFNNIDSAKEDGIQEKCDNFNNDSEQLATAVNSESNSQLILLHFSEKNTEEITEIDNICNHNAKPDEMDIVDENQEDLFSDDDVNMDDIDKIIENAEIMKDDSPMPKRAVDVNLKPIIMGSPGMVIDLDGGTIEPKKRSGVELLKERFTYYSKLKTPEEMEREKEKTLKPGAQHLKLKQELEDKIAEQRSIEWAKRLEEEKQQHKEMETILDDAEDSFEKLEKEGNDNEEQNEKDETSSESEEEEEPEENDVEMKDKPRKHNPMVDDEAEESDCDENEDETVPTATPHSNEDIANDDNNSEDDDESSDDESSESEEETNKPKKGRILKAFEDSDDEAEKVGNDETENIEDETTSNHKDAASPTEIQGSSQDDVLQLAQRHQSASDDLFTSQDSCNTNATTKGNNASDEVLGTQTFSILDSTTGINVDTELKSPSKTDALYMTQPYQDPNVNALLGASEIPITQLSQSQVIGDDILALCTGKFYDNEFISQLSINKNIDIQESEIAVDSNNTCDDEPSSKIDSSNEDNYISSKDATTLTEHNNYTQELKGTNESIRKINDDGTLKSILDELDDPEFDKPKVNKFFTGGKSQNEVNNQITEASQVKKRFIIDSEDEASENMDTEKGKKKKLKKKKLEKRALQISDDEEEEECEQGDEDYESDIEEDQERLVEYDSEENEIEVKLDKPKKKRKVADFFEQEAELTSEDEWVGSGDEDEKGLDRMEREEGDDEVFHQGKLRRELGQIHMRDVLDQDKREVRLIQELLFEDGDLGDGHRQRKFRWRNAGDDDENGTIVDEFGDTQEDEFESEEQWRKQRHERELFLRQLQENKEESLNVSVNRTTIIKANLSSKSMSTLLQEANKSNVEKTESPVVQEKKTSKDIPSPKKSFSIFQQNYHGSLLTRGRGALARLAALATPLVADDDAPKIGSLAPHKRNFVFAALTQEDEPKVTIKRKADADTGTPKLVKKMRIEDKQTRPNSSLLDHLNL